LGEVLGTAKWVRTIEIETKDVQIEDMKKMRRKIENVV